MFVIYKINFKSGKVYVGLTNNFNARRNQHLSDMHKEDYKVYRAMRKYNTTKNDFEIIEDSILTKEEAANREIYWIAFYDSYHNGYNSTPGGECGSYKLGEESHLAKLTDKDVITIRQIRSTKKYQAGEIYDFYKTKISKSTFLKIWNYTTWKHIAPELNTEELRIFYKHLRKQAKGEKGNHAKLTNDYVYQLRVRFYQNGESFQDLLKEAKVCRTSLQRVLNGTYYPDVKMPQSSIKYRIQNKQPLPSEIQELRKQYKIGKSLSELKTGVFVNYSDQAIKNIINYKTFTNIL